jgi:pimeloyl-ACP methyl ester carboxylesterase
MSHRPFTIHIDEAVLDDLRERLTNTRWAPSMRGSGWDNGVDVDHLAELVDAWAHDYSWREQESELNRLTQVMVDVDGDDLHAVHLRSDREDAPAVVLLHGWPDSFYRFARVAPLLREHYHVVAPSLPGFGFTTLAARTNAEAADAVAQAMVELGYGRYAVVGGDVGAGVASELARRHPGRVTSLYLTEVGYPTGQEDLSTFSPAEADFAQFIQTWWYAEGAYAMLQSSKPYVASVAHNDSPAGLLSWIVSFLNTGAQDHDVEATVGGRDALLTLATITWVTQSAGTMAEVYRLEAATQWSQAGPPTRIETLTALTIYARDAQFPREWAERTHHIKRYQHIEEGGHLAPLEIPETYAADVIRALHELGS